MPTILTPHDTERRNRVEDNDNGSGRRPPTDKRTGGGGDGDNWDDRPAGRRGPRERLVRYRFGVFSALAGDMIFFTVIVFVFFVIQSTKHFDAYSNYVNEWHPTAVPPILWLNTAVLLLSSITMELGRRRMFSEQDVMEEWLGLGRPTSRAAFPWLLATTFLGFLFIAGQYLAWRQLAIQHVFYHSNPSSHFFFLITGIHALHLFLGIVGLIAATLALRLSRQLETRQIFVDCVGWYWHSMGFFWIFLFSLLAFFQ